MRYAGTTSQWKDFKFWDKTLLLTETRYTAVMAIISNDYKEGFVRLILRYFMSSSVFIRTGEAVGH